MLKIVVLKSLANKLEAKKVVGRKWARAVRLINDVENWYNFGANQDGYTNSVWNKFENACIECACNARTIKEAQTMFDLKYAM